MKITEVLGTAPGNDAKRGLLLKMQIGNNEKPEIADARYYRGTFGWGDLQQLGWAKEHSEPAGRGEAEEWWEYTGPNSIIVAGREMKAGDTTSHVWVDYT